MNKLLSLATLLALTQLQAGTLKLPGSNTTRNAGTSISVLVQASGFPAGSKATISLVKSGTWVSTPWLFDVPVANGNNSIQIPIDWSFVDVGSYLIKVNVGNNQCTSTWLAKIRSAVIWPYSGSVFTRGQPAAVTWTTSFTGDVISIGLFSEPHAVNYWINAYEAWWFDPLDGRFDFVMPQEVIPGTYRFVIDFGTRVYEWNEEFNELDWHTEQTDSTQSEKITIR